MLLISTPSPPNSTAGRTIACGTPVPARMRSTAALPRKYEYWDEASGWVIDTWTIRATPASRAA